MNNVNLEIYHCVNLQICAQGENPTNHATVLSILKRKEGEKVEMMMINVDNMMMIIMMIRKMVIGDYDNDDVDDKDDGDNDDDNEDDNDNDGE